MKYVKLFFTLVFVVFGALLYMGNEWMSQTYILSFSKFPPQIRDAAEPLSAPLWAVIALAFLLGIVFTLINSSLNWLELMSKNRKISKLESKVSGGEEEQS